MQSSDFPSVVSPRMAGGGQAAPGALGQAVQQNAGASLMSEVQAVATAAESVIAKLRQIPTIDRDTFEQGVAAMKQGFAMVAASFQSGRQ